MANCLVLGSLLLAAAIVPLPLASQSTPQDPVQTPAGAIYNLNEREDVVRVPLTLHDSIAASDLDPHPVLFDVAFDKNHDTALLGSFLPSLAPDGALLITVKLDPPLRQGTYDVRLAIRLNEAAQARVKTKIKPRQEIVLQIVKPAAQLRPPGILVIENILGLPGLVSSYWVTPPLPLRESSHHSRLAEISVSQVENFSSDAGQLDRCKLRFDEKIPDIPAGQTAWAHYKTQCDPPVGIFKGTVQVDAPELSSPIDVVVNVKTRRTRWLIGLIALAGLLTGYLTRIALPLWVSRDQARVQGLNVLAQIDAETGRRKDAQFRQDCKEIRDKLHKTLRSNPKPDVLTEAIANASSGLTKALADLQGRRLAAQSKLDQLAKLVGTPWFLPPEIHEVVDAARPHLVEAHSALLADDVQAVIGACEVARVKLASGLRTPLQDWQTSLLALLDTLGAAAVPSSMGPNLKASVERVRGLINSVGVLEPDAMPEAVVQTLSSVDVARMATRQLILQMQRWPQDTLADIEGTLRPARLTDSKAVDALQSAAEMLLDSLRKAAEAPESAPDLRSTLDSLDRTWHGALLAQTSDPQLKTRIQEDLDKGEYSAAAREVAQNLAVLGTPNVAAAPATFRGELAAAQPTALWPGITDMRLQPRETVLTASWWNVDLSPGKIPALATRAAEESRMAQLVQTLVAGAGIVLVSYLANADKFIGTLADIAGIFSWAFVSDITIDALVTAARTLKKP
jgi:hypothetical protein